MNPMRQPALLKPAALLAALLALVDTMAQTKYWTGGSGAWADASNWSTRPDGDGGAGVPRSGEDVVIANATATVIELPAKAWCRELLVQAGAPLQFILPMGSELRLAGNWRMSGPVAWDGPGTVRLVQRNGGAELDLRGISLGSRLVLDGGASWTLLSDLVLAGTTPLVMRQGTLLTNGNKLEAGALQQEGNAAKHLFAATSAIVLLEHPDAGQWMDVIETGSSTLVVNGMATPWWPGLSALQDERDINVCGTGPGQTPFIVDAQLVTNYNGFGVQCRGACDATVTVTVTDGVGPFTYQWLNGGPTTPTWTSACGGPQIVIVTDVGQGISCPAQVQVSEPAPLGVIFIGAGTPPTCADVCDGSRTALAVGGVTPYFYNWNNGAGTNSSFFELCAGLNTLEITDANGCSFDTTFVFNVQPIQPNLTFTPTSCFGECDGTAEVAPVGGTGNLTITWSPPPPVGQGTPSIGGLCPGDYAVTIADVNGCDTTVTFTIDQPPPIQVDASSLDATCSGVCDGSATILASGAVGPFSFTWSPEPGSGQGTGVATGLCEGTYEVVVLDVATGCDTLVQVVINAPPAIDLQGVVTDASCADACDGAITLTPVGGTAPYGFAWDPPPPSGQGTGSISGLCPGPWQVTLTDAAGCDTTVVFTVAAPPPLEAVLTTTDVTCANACDGSADVVVTGGTPGYTFVWTPAPPIGQGTPNASGLCAGAYSVLVTDVNGCDTTIALVIQEPLPLEALPSQTDVTCGGLCDGTASVAVSGGTPGYTFLWTPAPAIGQGTATAGGLCPGPIEVLVSDANGCEVMVSFVIEDAVPIELSLQLVPATCPGVCDGEAAVIPTGGVAPYTFLWSPEPGAGQGTASVTGLCAQAYALTVTDAAGCDTTVAFTITEPDPITVNADLTDASCANACDGAIELTVSGGSGGFTYVWVPAPGTGQGTASAGGLCAGAYEVTITSGVCDTTLVFQINEPTPLVVDLTTTDATCAGACDGTATASLSGGAGGYILTWSPAPPVGQGTSAVSGLCAGVYTLLVVDANGCDTTLSFAVDEPPPLEVIPTSTNVTCGGSCDGTAGVTVSGGTPGYTYTWSPAPPVGQGTAQVEGLCAGAYEVEVVDAVGCTTTVQVVIEDAVPIDLSLQVVPASCPNVCDGSAGVIPSGGVAPYTFLWTPAPGSGQGTANATGLCPQAYTLTVTDAVGCDTTIAFTVPAPPTIDVVATVTDVDCSGACSGEVSLDVTGGAGGFLFNWSPEPGSGQGTATAQGLCAGTYEVTIVSGGCDTTLVFAIQEPPPLAVDLSTTDLGCSGDCDGTASAVVSGGAAPYTFVWTPEPGTGQGTPIAEGLCAGTYDLQVIDGNGCDTTLVFEILENLPIVVDLALTPSGCDSLCAGTATATVSGGVGPYTYAWGPGVIAGQGTSAATGLCSGIFTLLVTDALGCDTTVQFVIAAPSGIEALPSVQNASCNGVCDGGVVVTTTGGFPPYTWLWSPEPPAGQGTPAVSGLCAGTYTLLITDAVACDTTLLITVGEPDPLLPNGSSTNVTCNGPCDGTAAVAPTGGTAPYAFSWSPQPPQGLGTPAVSGLCPGDWSVTITDVSGCDTTVTFTILDVLPIEPDLQSTDVTCNGTCDGTAAVAPINGIAPFTYVWSPEPGAGQGSQQVTGLCAGSYSVLITDAVGCDTTVTFTILQPDAFTLDLSLEPEDCTAPCTGSASISVAGATGPYTYLWAPEPGAGQGTANATGLCAASNYTLTVIDALGCDTVIAFTVDPFDPIVANSSSTPASCSDVCDGTATVGPTGGTAPYTFTWSPEPLAGQGTPQATGLCAGVVEVTITDSDGCSSVASILILSPDPLTTNAVQQDVRCAGDCDGSVQLSVQGGTAPYLYTWSPAPPQGQGTALAQGLCPGTIAVQVTDANGCVVQQEFTITEPDPLVLTSVETPSACQVCSGASQLLIAGGTIPIAVEWTDASGVQVGNGDNIQDVCAGIYTATVTDGAGCVAGLTVTIDDADGEQLATVDGSTTCPTTCDGTVSVSFVCNEPPCTLEWTDAAGQPIGQSTATATDLCAGTYLAVVTNGAGCVSIEPATVQAPEGLTAAISSSPVSCAGACDGMATIGVSGAPGPYTFAWDPAPPTGQGTPFASGLCAGIYSIEIGDGNGCTTIATVLIVEPAPLDLSATVSDISCTGTCDGSIALVPSGGTAPYSYLWSPALPPGQGGASVSGLCAGDWTVVLTDANGCSITRTYTILEPASLGLSTNSTPSTCPVCDGTVSVTITGGTAPYVVQWSSGGLAVGNDPSLSGLCGGAYLVVVTDANGCSAQAVVQVADPAGETITTNDGQVSCANDCDGSVSADIACSAPPCVLQWTDATGAVVAGDVAVVTDLCPGEYTVQVTNADGCVSFATAIVSPSQTITPNLSSSPVSCSGLCDGSATVGPTGGVAPYTFTWSPEPGTGQGTPFAEGLCAGVYSVAIADASGCDTTITVLILEPQPLVLDAAVQNESCNAACDGAISAVVTGGTAPYLYQWDPAPGSGQGTPFAEGLCAGTYTLTVTDANGCVVQETFSIQGPDPLALAATSAASECGVCNGSISVQASGGTADYLYLWTLNGAIFGTADSLDGLCAGLYEVVVTDANGCVAALAVPLSDIEGEETNTEDGLVTCPGDCDGAVSVSFTCSDEPCSIAWFDGAGNDLGETGTQVNDLCAGTYFVQVTNGTGCITIDTAFVASPDPIVANLSTTPVTCFGDCDGTATVGPTGGVGGYTYTWAPEPINGQGSPLATDLCAGSYSVTITDVDGCSIEQGVLILSPDPLQANAQVTDVSCFGECDGEIDVTAQGGVLPYSYLWSPEPPVGQGTPVVQGLCPGEWSCLITDANGCQFNATFTVGEPTELVLDLQTTDNLCFGECAGTAQATPAGGIPGYTYSWTSSDGTVIAQGVDQVTALCSGDYSVLVTDTNGCSVAVDFSIGSPSALDAGLTVVGETCFGPCDGTASVSPSGGTGPYTIVWDPEPGAGQGTEAIADLCPGDYTVTISDAFGCDTTVTFTIDPFAPILDNAVVTNVACGGECSGSVVTAPSGGVGGYTLTWVPEPPNGQGSLEALQLCAGSYELLIADAVGCDSSFTYLITEPPVLQVTLENVVDASCADAADGAISTLVQGGTEPLTIAWAGPNGFSSSLEDIADLVPGTYVQTVTDANGCTVETPVEVDALSTVFADAGTDGEACSGTVIVLDGTASTGAVTYTWTDDQGNVVGTDPVVDLGVLPNGTYTFTLLVADGPCTATDQVTITVLALPIADAGPNRTIFLSETTTLGGSPTGPSGSTITWSPDSLLSGANEPNPIADPEQTTWFFVTVVGQDGCVAVDSVLVTVVPDVVITSGFTPNGDGFNDTWVIDFIELFPEVEVEIYNRWGEMLFRSVGYRTPWDGRYDGEPVPVGTYYYVVKLNDPQFPEAYTGPLTVIR